MKAGWRSVLALIGLMVLLSGCGDRKVDQALESDANGYICRKCATRFYLEREVFPDYCPQCKQPEIDQVLGYVCSADQHATLGPRGRAARVCEKCGGATSAISIPKETELKAWGAAKKTRAEVCGS